MKTKNLFAWMLAFLGFLLTFQMEAQINIPPLSPANWVKQQVGFTDIEIIYSRPSMRGRVIFGDLVPYDEIWRTGANAATTISFSQPVFINEKEVPSGKYSLFTIPGVSEWTIILNKNTSLWGTNGYQASMDLMRFQVKPQLLPLHFETFSIDVGEISQNAANIMLMWENTLVKFRISTKTDEQILAQIQSELDQPLKRVGNTYFAAANYYYDSHRDVDQAMLWVDEAIKLNGELYNYLNLKAKLFAEKGDYNKAIQFAKQSIEKAKNADQPAFVKMNELLIEKWRSLQ